MAKETKSIINLQKDGFFLTETINNGLEELAQESKGEIFT